MTQATGEMLLLSLPPICHLAASRKEVGFWAFRITSVLEKEKGKWLLSKGKGRGKWQHTEETNKASIKENNYGHSICFQGPCNGFVPF